jgi:outer membrane receptor protein involved in Fe transport
VHGNFAGTVTTETADRVEQTSRGLQGSLAGGSKWKTRVHGEWREEEVSGPRDTGVTTRSPSDSTLAEIDRTGESVPPGTRTLYAGSAHASRDFERVMVEMGTRWDSYHTDADSSTSLGTPDADKTESQWSFDGGVAVPIHAVELYTHAGTGFRVPNLDERYYNGFIHGALYLFGNPDLLPEESFSYEVGVRKAARWANRTLADFRLSAYRSDVENLITFEYVTQLYLIPRFQYRNVHRARLEGIEGSVRLVHGTADLRVDAGFPRGVDRDTDEELNDVGAPRMLVEAGSGMGWRDLRGAVRWRWSGEQNGADPQLASPAFTTTDVQLSTSWSGARATFAVRNVFDEEYREPLSFIPESGRTFLLSLDVAFGFGLSSRP